MMANELERVGYATDPNYAESLTALIRDNNLTQYDSGKSGSLPPSSGGGSAEQVGLKDAVETGKGIISELDKIRRWLTPNFIEDGWDAAIEGQNPIEKGYETLKTDFWTNTLVFLVLAGVAFLGYKTIAGGIK
jgi:hypothetical protein